MSSGAPDKVASNNFKLPSGLHARIFLIPLRLVYFNEATVVIVSTDIKSKQGNSHKNIIYYSYFHTLNHGIIIFELTLYTSYTRPRHILYVYHTSNLLIVKSCRNENKIIDRAHAVRTYSPYLYFSLPVTLIISNINNLANPDA